MGKSPERDREIENICQMIRNAAKAGIPAVKYNMSVLGVVRTESTRGRGGVHYSTFVYCRAKEGPPETDRYFIGELHMAVLHLKASDELELPELCMQCGAPATLHRSKTFSWFPPWLWILFFFCGLLPFVIVALIVTKRRTLRVPLCEEHKNHWLWRQLLVLGTLLGIGAIGIGATVISNVNDGRGNDPLGGLLCAGSLILLVAWIILAIAVQATSIRAKEITDRHITLAGVSKEFVEVYEREWHVSPERLDEFAREHWNQGRRSMRGKQVIDEDSDWIQPADNDKDRQSPPDAIQEEPT